MCRNIFRDDTRQDMVLPEKVCSDPDKGMVHHTIKYISKVIVHGIIFQKEFSNHAETFSALANCQEKRLFKLLIALVVWKTQLVEAGTREIIYYIQLLVVLKFYWFV